ncbi:MAG: hypothetical protein ACLPKW_14840, partial [Acetobacteraceae bacterium]
FTPEGEAVSGAAKGLGKLLPSTAEVLDGATAIAKDHPEGLTDETLTSAAKVLGQHALETGENPVAAAARAQAVPSVMQDFHGRMDAEAERAEEAAAEAGQLKIARDLGLAPEAELAPLPSEMPRGPVPPNSVLAETEGGGGFVRRLAGMDQAEAHATAEAEQETEASRTADTALGKKVEGPVSTFEPPSMADMLQDERGEFALPRVEMNITPETIRVPNPLLSARLTTGLKLLLAPQSLNRVGAGIIRAGLARTHAQMAFASEQLLRFGRAFGDLSSPDRLNFLHNFETGNLDAYAAGSPLRTFSAQAGELTDKAFEAMNERGLVESYTENYMGHWWQDPEGFQRFVSSRRPLEGPKGHTRERIYATIREGMEAGLRLKTDNPAKLILHSLGDMYRHVNGYDLFQEAQTANLLGEVKAGERIPTGMFPVNDPLFRHGVTKFYADQAMATMLNRTLSPSAFNTYEPLAAIRSAAQMSTMVTLFLSGAHFGYVTMAGINQALAKGLQQLSVGDLGGLKTVAGAPLAPIRYVANGIKLTRQITGIKDYDGTIPWLTKQFIESGGRVNLDKSVTSSSYGDFLQSIRGTVLPSSGRMGVLQDLAEMFRNEPQNPALGAAQIPAAWASAAIHILPRSVDTAAGLVFHYAQLMKQGAFMDRMKPHVNSGLGDDVLRQIGGRILDNMDNVFGQAIQDHSFWNKTASDIANTSMLAHSWFRGKVIAVARTPLELGQYGRSLFRGSPEQLGANAASVLASIPTAMMAGAFYGVLHETYKAAWNIKDYFYPPTGGTNKDGTPERGNIFSFFRDVSALTSHPIQAVENRINPLWQGLGDIMAAPWGVQWNGAAIRDPALPYAAQGQEYAHWLWQQYRPIVMQGPNENNPGGTGLTRLDHFFGVNPANQEITNPAKSEYYQQKQQREATAKLHKQEAAGQ